MKKIETIKEFAEDFENYRLSITPYELHLIKNALFSYALDLSFDMENYEWEFTQENQERLSEVENLIALINEMPF